MVAHPYNSSTQEAKEDHKFEVRLGDKARLCLKNQKEKKKGNIYCLIQQK
jgi:hypothetical protein